jgi:hypothetical protein
LAQIDSGITSKVHHFCDLFSARFEQNSGVHRYLATLLFRQLTTLSCKVSTFLAIWSHVSSLGAQLALSFMSPRSLIRNGKMEATDVP